MANGKKRTRRPPKLSQSQPAPDERLDADEPPEERRDVQHNSDEVQQHDNGSPPIPTVDDTTNFDEVAAPPAPSTSGDAPGGDDKIAAFLHRAGPVLALERGINAKSRVKLGAIAKELGLEDDEFDQAMALLQGRVAAPKLSPEEARDARRRRRAFHDLLGETLMQLPQRILTASMEEVLVQQGQSDYSLSAGEARQEIRELAKKLHVQCISHDEAARHVAQLAESTIGASGAVSKDVRNRIYAEASRWGLTPDQVEPILQQRVSQVRQGQSRAQMRSVVLVSGAAAAFVGVGGLLVWMIILSSLPSNPTAVEPPADGETEQTSADPASTTSSGAKKLPPVPAWWDADLAAHIVRLRLRLPSSSEALDGLRSASAEDRTEAYASLIALAQRSDEEEDDLLMLSAVLASCYVRDPSPESAAKLRDGLLNLAAGPGAKLPGSAKAYRLAFWSARTVAQSLLESKLSDERADAMAGGLGRTLQTVIDPQAPPIQLQRQVLSAEAEHLYKSLNAAAADNVDLAVSLHRGLSARANRYLSTAALERLATDYLTTVLPLLNNRWHEYENLIRQCVQSEDPLNVLKMVDLFERTSNVALRAMLESQLIVRTGLDRARRSVSELAIAVRDALGASDLTMPRDNRDRAKTWVAVAEKVLAQEDASAKDETKLLGQVVDLSHVATLGCALAQGELGTADFEQLLKEGPRRIAGSSSASPPPIRSEPRISDNELRELRRFCTSLGNYRRLQAVQRLSFLRGVASFARRVSDIEPQQAAELAAYLAAAKPVPEHEQVMAEMGNIFRWKNLRLALSDELPDSRLRGEHLAELLGAALERKVEHESGRRWREQMQAELLKSVLVELSVGDIAVEGDGAATRAAEAVAGSYVRQGKLLGVAPGRAGEGGSPSDAIVLLIEQLSARLSGDTLRSEDREMLGDLPHQMTVTDYLARNDLARTIRLERILLRLLAAETARRHGDRAADADALVADLRKQDAMSKHALSQLRNGQKALVQMWLLINRP